MSFRVIEATVPSGEAGDLPITIQVAVDVSQRQGLLRRFRLWSWITSAGMLILFPLIGYQIARQGIRPV